MAELLPAGTRLTRALINSIPRFVLSLVRPGPGIRIFPAGDGGICISADSGGQRIGSGGVGGGGGGVKSRFAYVAYLNSDGDTLQAYLWDPVTENWEGATTTIYKPLGLQAQFYNGKTLIYADGTTRDYDVTDLDIRYQRRASWTEGSDDYEVVEEITPPYFLGRIYVFEDDYGNLVDANNDGRCWGATE